MGAADRFGYARWSTEIGSLTLNSRKIPVRIYFSSDPRLPTGCLGQGWLFPLMESTLIEENQKTLRWHRPDSKIWHLHLSRGAFDSKSDPNLQIYETGSTRWKATRKKGTRRFVLTDTKSGSELVYDEGILVRFRFSGNADGTNSYAINYTSRRRPRQLMDTKTGQPLLEIIYTERNQAEKIVIGGHRIDLGWGFASLIDFGTGPYLATLSGDTGEIKMTYSSKQTESANRIEISKQGTGSPLELEWKANSGFIYKDSDSTYEIKNESLAQHGNTVGNTVSKGKKNATIVPEYNWRPSEAEVTRTDHEGKRNYRFFDKKKGTLTGMARR
jgi:hypothetical protein